MSDILRQVDEDLRKEKLSNLFKKYGLYVILTLVITIGSVIGYQVMVSIDKSKNEKLIETYIKATNSKNISEQYSLLDELINANNNYISSIAELKIANLKIENGNIKDGILDLEKLTDDEKYDPIIADLATYFLLLLKIDNSSEEEFMSYLTDDRMRDSNFKYLFNELISFKKLMLGKNEESKKNFQHLIDTPDVPVEIKIRANKFIEIID